MNNKQKAEKIVENKLSFYTHLLVYLIVNTFLIVFNSLNYYGHFWAIYPLFGWGIGLFFHFINTFDVFGSTNLKKKMLAKELAKLEREE